MESLEEFQEKDGFSRGTPGKMPGKTSGRNSGDIPYAIPGEIGCGIQGEIYEEFLLKNPGSTSGGNPGGIRGGSLAVKNS